MEIDLVVEEGQKLTRHPVKLPIRIGRESSSDLWLNIPEISRSQLDVLEKDGRVVLRQLGRRPTRVGSQVLKRKGEMLAWGEGDVISLPGVQIRYQSNGDLTPPLGRIDDFKVESVPISPHSNSEPGGTVAILPKEALAVPERHRGKVAPIWSTNSDLERWFNFRLLISITLAALAIGGLITLGAQGEKALSPGPLSDIHAAVVMDGCQSCHLPGEDVVDKGCIGCHGLAEELLTGPSVHRVGPHFEGPAAPSCGACHVEHRGPDADIRRPRGGACLDCHSQAHRMDSALVAPLALEPRSKLPCSGCHAGHPSKGQPSTQAITLSISSEITPKEPATKSTLLAMSMLLALTLFPALGVVFWRTHRKAAAEPLSTPVEVTIPAAQIPHINIQTCVGCRACVDACPFDVLEILSGVAQVTAADACHGIALCETACPNGSLTLIEGKEKEGIPVISAELESTLQPRIFIVGDLTGLPLIKNAINQGVQAVDAIAKREPIPKMDTDIAIIGAGPGGLSAALRAAELGLGFRIFERETLAHTIKSFPRQKLVMAQPFELPLLGRFPMAECSKEDLLKRWEVLITRSQLKVEEHCEVLNCSPIHSGGFQLLTKAGSLSASFVILATGIRGKPRRLGVAGETLEKVAYGLTDAQRYQNKRILVVGGGDSALEAALALAAQPGNQVSLSYRKDKITRAKTRNKEKLLEAIGSGRIQALWSSTVREIGPLKVLLDESGSELSIPNDFVFVFAGGEPAVGFLKSVGVL